MGKRNRGRRYFEVKKVGTSTKKRRESDNRGNPGKRALVIDLTEELDHSADEHSGHRVRQKGRESPWSVEVSSCSTDSDEEEKEDSEDYLIHRDKHQQGSKTLVTELDDVVIVEAKKEGGECTLTVDEDIHSKSVLKVTEMASKREELHAAAHGDSRMNRKKEKRRRGKIKEKRDWIDERTERETVSSSVTDSSLSGQEDTEDGEEEYMRKEKSKRKRNTRGHDPDIKDYGNKRRRRSIEDNMKRSSEDNIEMSFEDNMERSYEDNMERSHEELNEELHVDVQVDREDRVTEDRPRIAAHRYKEDVLLIIQEREVCLKGFCRIKCLFGGVSILGYNVSQHSEKFVDFYSPESNSLLSLQCDFLADTAETQKQLSNIYSKYQLDEYYEGRSKPQCGDVVIVLLRKLTSYYCDYISTISPYTKLFTPSNGERNKHSYKDLSCIGVHYVPKFSKVPRVKISEDYKLVEEKWCSVLNSDVLPIVVVCGSKNTGKSTMNRFLLNSTLNRTKGLYYLDCDVGQTEFSPPGCVSLNYVQNPILGPPFCHQCLSENTYYFGAITPAGNPDYYIQCVQKCVEAYKVVGVKVPLIVNTMGWNKGLGLDLLIDTLRMVQPTLVIQLNCPKPHLNFPPLTSYNVMKEEGWIKKSKSSGIDWTEAFLECRHDLITIDAPVDPQQLDLSPISLKPVDHRNLAILSYFAKDFHTGMTLTSVTPYTVPWKDIAIYVHSQSIPHSQILYAVNASVVALCVADLKKAYRTRDEKPWQFKSLPVCHCLGFGFVRGIDSTTGEIYLVTPLLPYQLSSVNTIVRGDLNIPDQVLLNQRMENVSYVSMTTTTIGSSSLQQRRHMPRRDKLS